MQLSRNPSNTFFQTNSIKELAATSRSTSFNKLKQQDLLASNQRKQLQKSRASSIKRLDPRQFQHRQVFHSKLYKTVGEPQQLKKYFRIQLNTNQRTGNQRMNLMSQHFQKIWKVFQSNNYYESQNMKQCFKSIMHHTKVIGLNKDIESNSALQNIIHTLLNLMENIMIELSTKVSQLTEYKKTEQQNLTNLQRKKELVSQLELKKLEKNLKYQQESELKNLLHSYKSQIGFMDYEMKKGVLKNEQLEVSINEMKRNMAELKNQNEKMRKQKEKLNDWKQEYQYKIKKLKEQLEVAHIVKQQNLQDKINYILGWKL